jgi:3-dehydroquinate synthase
MEDLRAVFEINSRLKNYTVGFIHIRSNWLNFSSNYDVVFIDDKLDYLTQYENVIALNCDEYLKSFSSIETILDYLIDRSVTKNSKILIVGGGVLQDAVSFCCSIFSRGVSFDFVPTTLLAMLDSCIGGKTSINYKLSKNKLGTYYPPNFVYIDLSFTESLPAEQILSGIGEYFKFCILQNKLDELNNFFANRFKLEHSLIFESLQFKKKYIEIDEFDQNTRLILNYGHTFGHAIEATSNYQIPHGIGVVLGIIIANRYSLELGLMEKEDVENIEKYAFELSNKFTYNFDWFHFENLYKFIKNDKKNYANRINMILYDKSVSSFRIVGMENSVFEENFPRIMVTLKDKLNFNL